MGVFYVTVGLGNPARDRFEEVRALVDTGAMWTWVPRDILERLGHQPTVKRRLQTADNRIIERDAAEIPIRIDGEVLSPLCIFGDPASHDVSTVNVADSRSISREYCAAGTIATSTHNNTPSTISGKSTDIDGTTKPITGSTIPTNRNNRGAWHSPSTLNSKSLLSTSFRPGKNTVPTQ